ncbi:MAG: M20/M25/M40 family metallo-hydrolase [Bdellovibrionales bacterium]|nr:M20/M25/M40 family metallo-hydrolase [Bdellovibrionales bacterium]
MEKVLSTFERRFDQHLEDLKSLVRIPSVSFEGFDPQNVRRSAEAVAALLRKNGLEKVEILDLPGAHPYVYGERLRAPGKPTLLLYAHHDVQPPGREELWKSHPFEPTLREGPGGVRLYARGAADDKAGILVHLAAISSFMEALGELPVNVKIVIEGEEEVGSSHLPVFLEKYKAKLQADVLVLTDTSNFDCGYPALTISLRGLVGVNIEVRSISHSVHSGMWGGPVPDPAMALSKMLASLVDEQGRIAVPGVLEQVRPLSDHERKSFEQVPYDERDFRKQVGLVPGAKLLQEGPNPIVQIFRYPSLTVNAIQASSRKQAGNVLNDTAWARVTIRLVQDMDPDRVLKQLEDHLRKVTLWGLEVSIHQDRGSGPWAVDPNQTSRSQTTFECATKALKNGYGKTPLFLGCGGSIPFVKPFAEALGGAPALLVGVEDPYTNAHGENESLLISDFKKACLSQIYLFDELSRAADKVRR